MIRLLLSNSIHSLKNIRAAQCWDEEEPERCEGLVWDEDRGGPIGPVGGADETRVVGLAL